MIGRSLGYRTGLYLHALTPPVSPPDSGDDSYSHDARPPDGRRLRLSSTRRQTQGQAPSSFSLLVEFPSTNSPGGFAQKWPGRPPSLGDSSTPEHSRWSWLTTIAHAIVHGGPRRTPWLTGHWRSRTARIHWPLHCSPLTLHTVLLECRAVAYPARPKRSRFPCLLPASWPRLSPRPLSPGVWPPPSTSARPASPQTIFFLLPSPQEAAQTGFPSIGPSGRSGRLAMLPRSAC